jgi:HAE1 family hydrophobic/amphiphilic exporter-1
MNWPEFSVNKPVTVIVIMLIFLTIGIISIVKLPLEMMPDISFPGLMVQVPYPSSSPEEVERIITRPLEEILSTINNLKSISSTSSSTGSWIRTEFNSGTNMDLASMEIRDKIDQIRDNLPDDIERIRIRRWSTSDRPIIYFNLALPGDRENLFHWSENFILPELERIEGVANVDIRGIRNKVLTISLEPEVFYSSSIRIMDLIDTIRNNNINISAGYLEEDHQRFIVRVPGELKIVEEITGLPLNDKGLKIKDVARVTYDYPEQEDYHRLNAKDSLRFMIYRASTANVVKVCQSVKAAVYKMRDNEPALKGMDVIFYRDQSEDILNSLRDLTLSGIIGGLLAVITLLFFLRKFRTTIIIAMAIPMAIVFTFSFMYLYRAIFGSTITINIISLSGLMMAVGMLVDNSVVVLENIFRLRQEKGFSALKASVIGSSEVAMAVTASTLTTLVVFISLGFVSGSGFGRFLKDFAITISLALIASLIVSLTFIPLAGSRLLKGKAKEKAKWLVKLTSFYEGVISFTIKNWKTKLVTVGVAATIMISAIYMFTHIEREFMAGSDEREIEVNIYMPKSFSLDQMKALFYNYEEILKKNEKELAIDYMTSSFGVRRLRQGRYRGELELTLKETGASVSEVRDRLKKLLPRVPGITYEFGERRFRGGHRHGLSVELIGMDYTKLTELVPEVMEKLRAIEEVDDVTSDLEGGETQLMVRVDRKKAESSGVDSRTIARTISSSISERPIGKFKTENKEIDIILKLQGNRGFSEDDLKNISIRTTSKQIPISAISSFSYRMGSTSIMKENKKSKLRISINSQERGMMKMSRKISAAMETISFPEGYSWSLGSGWRRFRESEEGSNMAIILALIFIYIIMASLFESFSHPFTILMTIPLSLFGVAIFFTITGITLNTSSYLGLLTLFGIVVNNGIILIDHIRTLRKQGLAKNAAIVQAGKDRMRPIIMTAITTIFGVLPLAMPVLFPQFFQAASRRAQMWAPISVAILGGLTTSTFFTLIILPTFYSISDSVTSRLKFFFGFQSNKV